jgi:hypothetical protein
MVLIYGPPKAKRARLDLESLIEHVQGRLHASPIFRRRLMRVPLELDYPYWVDDEHFDVEYHVQYSCLPKPGTWRQLTRFVSKYHNKPMDMNRPLWEVCMLDGVDGIDGIPKGSFALILKAHHAAVDGATGMQFFAAFRTSTKTARLRLSAHRARARRRDPRDARRALINNTRSPIRLWTLWRAAWHVPVLFRKLSGGDGDDQALGPGAVQQTRSPQKHFGLLVRVERFQAHQVTRRGSDDQRRRPGSLWRRIEKVPAGSQGSAGRVPGRLGADQCKAEGRLPG